MPELQAQRTLVKSLPELWAELSDPAALARHLGEFGEIRITRSVPEQTVAWEGERASGTVELSASGWGTKVTLRARLAESQSDAPPAEPAEQPSSDVTRPADPFELINSLARDPLPRVADSVDDADAEPLDHGDAEPLDHADAEPLDPDTEFLDGADAQLDPALPEPTPAAEPAPELVPAAEAAPAPEWAAEAPAHEIGPDQDVPENWFSDSSEFGADAGVPVTPTARGARRAGFFQRFFGRRTAALEIHDVPEFRPGGTPVPALDIPPAAEPDGAASAPETEVVGLADEPQVVGFADEPAVVGFADEPEVEAQMPVAEAEMPAPEDFELPTPEPEIEPPMPEAEILDGAPEAAQVTPDPDPASAMANPEPEPATVNADPEPATVNADPEPAMTPTPDDPTAEPDLDFERAEAVLTGVLNELGTARHRPFSRG